MHASRYLLILALAALLVACGGKDKALVEGDNAPWRSTPPGGAVILAGSLEGAAVQVFLDRLAGGHAALVPTDSTVASDPMPDVVSALEKAAGRSGFALPVDVPYTNCARTESRENGDILYGADGVWFHGGVGGSAQLLPCLLREDGSPTEVWTQTLALSDRGGVIAGSGAGAEMLGAVVLDAKRKDYTPPAEVRWKARQGLGLLNDWIVVVMTDPGKDQEWLAAPLGLNPGTRALAISPDGAVLVEGGHVTRLSGEACIVRLPESVEGQRPIKSIEVEPLP